MRFKRLVISILALIFAISVFSFTPVFADAGNGIVQQICGIHSNLANNTNFQIGPLAASTTLGNKLYAVANVQGSGNTVITGVNITDTQNVGQYSLRIRSLDQGNSLYDGVFNHTVGVAGSTLFNAKFTESAGASNQNLQYCVYELSSVVTTFTTHTSEGGSMPISTQAANSGSLVLAGGVYNSSPLGVGHIMFYNGTDDVPLQSNFSDIGHSLGAGSFSGGAVIAFTEEADIAFPLIVTLTVTAWNTIDPATPTTWILAALYIILIPSMFWGFLKAYRAKPSTLVFTTLLGLTIAGFLGTISGVELGTNAVLPLGVALFFGISLAVYAVRSRSRQLTG